MCVYKVYNRHKSHPKCRVHPCTEASGFPCTRPRTVRGKLMTPRCSQSFLHVVFGAVQWPQAKEFSASVSSFQAARSANFANRLTSRNMSFFQCFLHTNQNLHFSRFRFSFPLFPETLFKAANHSRRPIQFAGPGSRQIKSQFNVIEFHWELMKFGHSKKLCYHSNHHTVTITVSCQVDLILR